MKYLDLQKINQPYIHAADNVLNSGWYLRGEVTQRFEQNYANYIGTGFCIGCANGLDALTLIFRAYKEMGVMQDGDEVIVPANTYIASILAITENRLVPVLVEPDISTLQIDDSLIEAAMTERTRAVMIVHLYGRCAYTKMIADFCKSYGFKLIEDNAQAHGCLYDAISPCRRTGSLGDAAGHSFYPTKNLGAFGDAGAVTTSDEKLAAVIRSLGNYGSSRKYVFDYEGRNSRIDEVQAAILDVKLKDLDACNRRRKQIADRYINKVANPLIHIPQSERDSVWHIFPVLCEQRDRLRLYLADHDVETEIHYPIPPHHQQCYTMWNTLTLPVTERIHAQELSLPCNPAMTEEETDRIIDLLNSFA